MESLSSWTLCLSTQPKFTYLHKIYVGFVIQYKVKPDHLKEISVTYANRQIKIIIIIIPLKKDW